MFSRLVKLFKCSEYEDLDRSNTEQKDMEGSLAHMLPVTYAYSTETKVGQETFTIEQAIDQIGFGRFQVKLSIMTGFVWMSDAMEMMILAVLAPALHCIWQLTGLEEAAITIFVFCGMTSTSGLWGSLCDNYGRKTGLVMSSLVTVYFGLLSAFSPNLMWMLILRGLAGCGIGGAPQSITLYAEFLPAKHRAVCITLVEVFWAIGACFEMIIALLVMPTLGWRWLLGISTFPLFLISVCCWWLPESARFDVMQGDYDKAVKTLEKIAYENGQPLPPGKLVHLQPQYIKHGRLKDLLSPPFRKTTLLLWTIWMTASFCYYGIVLLTTALYETPNNCYDEKFKMEETCAIECRSLTREDLVDTIWTTMAEFPGLGLAVVLLEKIGRKYTMALLFGGFVIFVLLVNFCMQRSLLTVFLFVARAFISGAFQGVYIYTPEFYPTNLRALGLGICSGMARVGATITPFVAQVLLKTSPLFAISAYGLTCLVAVVCSLLLPYETKGKVMKVMT
ncbi:synaptic vesicle 2-related protein-like [Babylonia areolata]|uniref:synaptic vesicle 2-related protein-like n=1 Tax=Babylonia areolata TaxID=304850 RepID=UPI003FD452D0